MQTEIYNCTKDCPQRHPGCQDTCETQIRARARRAKARQKHNAEMEIFAYRKDKFGREQP